MLRQFCSLFAVCTLSFVLIGCGGEEGDGHKSDETPGGQATPPAEQLEDEKAMEDYAKEQEKLAK